MPKQREPRGGPHILTRLAVPVPKTMFFEDLELEGLYGVYRGYIGYILGLYWDNGKENGSYYEGEMKGKGFLEP